MNQIFLNGITIEQLAEKLLPLLNGKSPCESSHIPKEILTREETCQLLSINKTSLWKYTKAGKLKSYGIGNRVFYKRSEVVESLTPLNF